MKSIVTGGAGFIGSNLVDELVKKMTEHDLELAEREAHASAFSR